jgi:BED zinc finger
MQSTLFIVSKMAAGSEVGKESKPKRRLEKRSKVWEHIIEEEVNGSTKAKCKYCDSCFKRDVHGNTSTLIRHLKDSCLKVPKEVRAQFIDKFGKEGIAQSSENNEREITTQPSKKRMVIDQPSIVDFRDKVRNGLTLEKMSEIRVKDAILTDLLFAPPHIKEAWSNSMAMDIEKEICAYHQREKI